MLIVTDYMDYAHVKPIRSISLYDRILSDLKIIASFMQHWSLCFLHNK